MTPSFDLGAELLSHAAIAKNILNDTMVKLGGDERGRPHVKTHPSPCISDIDFLIAQDQNGFNAGSFLLRRSFFTRFLLEMWVDPIFLFRDSPGREQDTILDLFLQHPIIREHTGLIDMHWFNAYPVGGTGTGWSDGDVAVHFAGCWVEHHCTEYFEDFWSRRALVKDLPNGEERLRKASDRRGGRSPIYT
jgi:galactosyl transferase GMA12/MNN10 family